MTKNLSFTDCIDRLQRSVIDKFDLSYVERDDDELEESLRADLKFLIEEATRALRAVYVYGGAQDAMHKHMLSEMMQIERARDEAREVARRFFQCGGPFMKDMQHQLIAENPWLEGSE